jgi:signal transduction histidine kinase
MSNIVHFKTHTLLKNLIGKDLINDDNIAITELVKNSYDANSSNVLLKFEGLKKGLEETRLLISDIGDGMNEQDVIEKWLNIAYSAKKQARQIEGAYLAGNKGVGRFSCDRLGKQLDMFTRVKNGKISHLKIDWEAFEIEGNKDLTIQDIDVALNEVTEEFVLEKCGIEISESGTILLVSHLRSEWDKERLIKLKRDLEKFINPNQLFLKGGFEIDLSADDFKESDPEGDYTKSVNGAIKNLIFDKLKFKATYIEYKTVDDGKFIRTSLYHDGHPVYWVEEVNHYQEFLNHFSITIYFLNAYKKSYFTRQTGIRAIDFGSIYLFLNGFRVAPYGERGNDWLKLDIRRGQGHARFFGSRDVVGRIEVFDSKDTLQPISSREGLKETKAFSALKEEFFMQCLRRLEKFVVDGLSWDSVPQNVRDEISHQELDWENTNEKYTESSEKKSRRFSLSILNLIGIKKKDLKQLWINSELLSELSEERKEEVKNIINSISSYDSDVIDNDLKAKLSSISKLILEKEEALRREREERQKSLETVIKLEDELFEKEEKLGTLQTEVELKQNTITSLEKEKETVKAQSLFLKAVSTLDEKSLLTYHHQICNDAATIENYLGRTIRALNDDDVKKALGFVEKIAKANKKIIATAQYATKANFKAGTKKEITDIPSFISQYLKNVASEFSASGLQINIDNQVNSHFEIPLKRIELSILLDNLVSNASKAEAKKVDVSMSLLSNNQLLVLFVDDGRGLSESIDVSDVFDFGMTTTNGSGLGLYHIKEFMNSIESEIEMIKGTSKGVEIRMVFNK